MLWTKSAPIKHSISFCNEKCDYQPLAGFPVNQTNFWENSVASNFPAAPLCFVTPHPMLYGGSRVHLTRKNLVLKHVNTGSVKQWRESANLRFELGQNIPFSMKWKKMKETGNSCQGSWTLYNNCLIGPTTQWVIEGWFKNENKWIWFWCLDSLEMLAKVVDTDWYNTMELIIWFWKGNWKTSKQTKTHFTIPRPSSLKLRLLKNWIGIQSGVWKLLNRSLIGSSALAWYTGKTSAWCVW